MDSVQKKKKKRKKRKEKRKKQKTKTKTNEVPLKKQLDKNVDMKV